jgi:uncharacterized paraquat-inducible protein A
MNTLPSSLGNTDLHWQRREREEREARENEACEVCHTFLNEKGECPKCLMDELKEDR